MLPQWEDCMLATHFHWDLLCCFMWSISLWDLSELSLVLSTLHGRPHLPYTWRPGVLKLNQAAWISNSKAFNQASTPGSCRRVFIAFDVCHFCHSALRWPEELPPILHTISAHPRKHRPELVASWMIFNTTHRNFIGSQLCPCKQATAVKNWYTFWLKASFSFIFLNTSIWSTSMRWDWTCWGQAMERLLLQSYFMLNVAGCEHAWAWVSFGSFRSMSCLCFTSWIAFEAKCFSFSVRVCCPNPWPSETSWTIDANCKHANSACINLQLIVSDMGLESNNSTHAASCSTQIIRKSRESYARLCWPRHVSFKNRAPMTRITAKPMT